MSALGYIFGVIVPYAAITLFILGFVYRIWEWAKAPVPFHIPTTCGQQKCLPWIKANNFESPHNTVGVVGRMMGEVLLFRSLFRNTKTEVDAKAQSVIYRGNKYLWLGALAFHWSLLIVLFRHVRFFVEPIPSAILLVQDIDGIFQLLVPTLYVTDLVILIALSYLFLRRVVNPQIRYISLLSDYFAVLLILSIALSGVLMRYIYKVDLLKVKEMALGLVSFRPVVPEGIGLPFYIHLFLVSVLIAYFPFSKLMHMPGVFLSPTRNLKNNSRMRRHINPWNYPVKLHTYPEWENENRAALEEVGLLEKKGGDQK